MAEIVVAVDGSSVRASLGDRIVVRLPENASTGYQWTVSGLDASLAVESNRLELPDPLLPGAPSTRVVRLRPTAPGRAVISLQLKRRWEHEPVERFSAEVVVA